MRSMTAYGRAEHQHEGLAFVVEIRSVNSRYRDVLLRMPRELQALEKEQKDLIAARVGRGRVEASVQLQSDGQAEVYALKLNEPLVESYFKIFDQLAERWGLDREIRLDTLCQMKDIIILEPRDRDLEKLRPGLMAALEAALVSLDEMRSREGATIEADLRARLSGLAEQAAAIQERAPGLVAAYQDRLKENVRRLLEEVACDEGRIAQEAALFAERSDVTEELVRLGSHVEQFRTYLSAAEPVGRRLDFLVQEMHREVNTLGSKASDAGISGMVVEMKAELEKIREQIQNVE